MADRNAQFAPAYAQLDALKAATQEFDARTAEIEAAQAASNDLARRANEVAWKLVEHSGASHADKAAAEQLAQQAEEAKIKSANNSPLFQAAVAASQSRGAAWLALEATVQSLRDNPGAIENMAGTPL